MWLGMAGRRPHRVPHNKFNFLYRIITKLQYTELKLSCWNDLVVKNYIYSNGDLDLWLNDHNNFSFVYRIITKLGHMIPLWKGKNPIYCGVITIIPFDNLHRRVYFVMHTCLVVFANKDFCYFWLTLSPNCWKHNSAKSLNKLTVMLFVHPPVEGEEPYLLWGHYHYTVW
jgi:hypothetical protein